MFKYIVLPLDWYSFQSVPHSFNWIYSTEFTTWFFTSYYDFLVKFYNLYLHITMTTIKTLSVVLITYGLDVVAGSWPWNLYLTKKGKNKYKMKRKETGSFLYSTSIIILGLFRRIANSETLTLEKLKLNNRRIKYTNKCLFCFYFEKYDNGESKMKWDDCIIITQCRSILSVNILLMCSVISFLLIIAVF